MTATKSEWQRVTKARPCPVCGKDHWCSFIGPDDSPELVCCMRVESDRPAKNGGHYHRLRDSDVWRRPTRRRVRTVATKPDEKPARDFARVAAEARDAMGTGLLGRLSADLGVSPESLQRLGVGWSWRHVAYTFPMSDPTGRIVGIRLRLRDGRKLAVKGGREGLFLPEGIEPGGRLLVCEGATDTAALLDLGFPAVGRPSCTGGVKHVCELVRQLQPTDVVVVADGDAPGQDGAERLASVLVAYCPAVRVLTPPAGVKDARQWKAAGATRADMAAVIDAAPVRRLKVTMSKKGGRNGRAKQTR